MSEAVLTKSLQSEWHLQGWSITHEPLLQRCQWVNNQRGTSAIVHAKGADFLWVVRFQTYARRSVYHPGHKIHQHYSPPLVYCAVTAATRMVLPARMLGRPPCRPGIPWLFHAARNGRIPALTTCKATKKRSAAPWALCRLNLAAQLRKKLKSKIDHLLF